MKAGVIGLGIGEQHVRTYLAHEAVEEVAVCDLLADKVEKVCGLAPRVVAVRDAETLLADPSIAVVSVASYDDVHYAQIMAALEAGKHVFAEKPLCQFEGQARELRSMLAKRPGLGLSSNLVLRTCPLFCRVREAIQTGEMGETFAIEGDYLWGRRHKLVSGWRRKMSCYSIILGAAIHIIDLLLWLTGRRPQEVHCWGNNLALREAKTDFDDFVSIHMRFENGLIAKVTASGGCQHPHFHRLAVYGSRLSFLHDLTGSVWLESSDPSVRLRRAQEAYPARESRGGVQASFLDWIVNKRATPIVSHDEVFDVMSVCFAAQRSLETGRPVAIDYL